MEYFSYKGECSMMSIICIHHTKNDQCSLQTQHMTIHCWLSGGVSMFEKGVQQIKKHTYGYKQII